MHFLTPGLLPWALLLIPLTLLFLVRRRPRRIRVSTLVFFKSLSKVYQESPWLRRLKRILAFAIAATMLLCLVGALAHLVVAPKRDEVRSVLIVVDCSASMAATNTEGVSRVDEARERIRQRLAGVPSSVAVLLMRYDSRPEIILPHSLDRRALARALEGLAAQPIAGDRQAALRLAGRLAELQAPAVIWHASDAPAPPAGLTSTDAGPAPATAETLADGPLPEGVALVTIDVGLETPRNAGITGFSIRPRPLERGRFDAFVEVSASGPGPVEVQLEIQVDGRLVSLRDLTIAPAGFERLLVPIEGATGDTLTLIAKAEGDVLRADDRVLARIPEMQPIRLLWVREGSRVDPFTALALAALGEDGVLEAYEAEPSAYAGLRDRFDVVLFDGWLPKEWPTEIPALVLKPPRSLGPIKTAPIAGAGLPTEGLRAIDESHPVLFGVASQRVSVTQTCVLDADGVLTPLWVGDMGPLLVAGEVGGQKLVVMAFAPDRSEHLGLLASYPLLVGNTVFWLAQDEAARRSGNNRRTGSLVDTSAAPLRWDAPTNRPQDPTSREGRGPSAVQVAVLDRQGLWRIGDALGSASLLSKNESVLPARTSPTLAAEGQVKGGWFRGDFRPALLWLLFWLLLLEAWLFHRHAVY